MKNLLVELYTNIFYVSLNGKALQKIVVKVLLFKKRIRQCYTLRFQTKVKVRKTVSALRDEKE